MAVRKLLAQDDSQEAQWLKIDSNSKYINNHSSEWQFLFGPNSEPTNSAQVLKLAAQLDTVTLDTIRFIGYLYNPKTGGIDNASGVTFNIYRVEDINTPQWNDLFITTIPGVLQSNSYYFTDASISSLTGAILDGDTTLMIEGVATRSGTTYRDRIYVNHLGVYQSIVSLRQAVDFLDITKKDI